MTLILGELTLHSFGIVGVLLDFMVRFSSFIYQLLGIV